MQIHHDVRLRPGLRVVETMRGWNLWDDRAEDTVFYEDSGTLDELVERISGDSMLVEDEATV